jgi:hypothetical protein
MPVPAVAAGLRYTELAVALYASDMPTSRREDPSVEQVWMFVVQGIERVGVERIREIARESCRLNLREDWAGHARLWPSIRRHDRAHGQAFLLRSSPL